MQSILQTILINTLVGIIIFGGFFIYWGRASGWFVEGGLVYEWWKKKRIEMKKKSKSKKTKK